jgi:gamma-glutamylcyclotransferase (GGCT)/AIG2-like uncharacterized protein YtfP
MTMYFAYGSNMSRKLMGRFAPDARPLGRAELRGYRFTITSDGYASVAPDLTATVHGVVWRISPRDRVRLDGWENVAAGLYRPRLLPVRLDGRRISALVYVARPGREGAAKPGYLELVCGAAREWALPAGYCRNLERFVTARPSGRDKPFKGPAVMFGESG